jgi:hypothetical protein
VATRDEYDSRIKTYIEFIDEFLAVFRGELSLTDLRQLTLKEARMLRDQRIKTRSKQSSNMEDIMRSMS